MLLSLLNVLRLFVGVGGAYVGYMLMKKYTKKTGFECIGVGCVFGICVGLMFASVTKIDAERKIEEDKRAAWTQQRDKENFERKEKRVHPQNLWVTSGSGSFPSV